MIERGDEEVRKCGIWRKRERGRGRKDEKSERSGEKALDYYLNLIGGGQFFLLHSMCSKPIESARVVVNARSFVSGFLYVVVILRFTWKRRDFRTSKMEERGKYKKYQRKKEIWRKSVICGIFRIVIVQRESRRGKTACGTCNRK